MDVRRTWCVIAVTVAAAGLLTAADGRAAVSCGGSDVAYVGYYRTGANRGTYLATISAASGEVVGEPVKLPDKSGAVRDIAVGADGTKIYLSTMYREPGGGSLGMSTPIKEFDATKREFTTVDDGDSNLPRLAVTKDGKRLYTTIPGKLKVIALETGFTKQTFDLKRGTATGFLVSPDESKVVLIHPKKQWLSVVDARTGAELGSASTGNIAVDVTLSRDGRLAYVLTADGVVTEIDLTSWRRRRVTVDSQPTGLALSPDGSSLYVTGGSPRGTPGWVARVDVSSLSGVQQLMRNPRSRPGRPAVTSNGRCLYFVNNGRLTVINTSDGTVADLMEADRGAVKVKPAQP